MVTLSVQLYGATETALNELVKMGYANTKAEAIRQAILHLATELRQFKSGPRDEWREYAAKRALEDWDDADKLFKF